MERIDGPMMMDAMLKRLWALPSAAATLADLHDRLHAIPAPDWLRQMPGGGDAARPSRSAPAERDRAPGARAGGHRLGERVAR